MQSGILGAGPQQVGAQQIRSQQLNEAKQDLLGAHALQYLVHSVEVVEALLCAHDTLSAADRMPTITAACNVWPAQNMPACRARAGSRKTWTNVAVHRRI